MLKIVKLLLTAVADAQYEVIASSCQGDASKISSAAYNQGLLLHQALECIPNPSAERTTRMVAFKLGKVLKQQVNVCYMGTYACRLFGALIYVGYMGHLYICRLYGAPIYVGYHTHLLLYPPYECTYGGYYGLVVVTPRPPPRPQTFHRSHDNLKNPYRIASIFYI